MKWGPVTGCLDVLYPRTCAGCGGAVGRESQYLCWDCLSELLLVRPPYCRLCGDPVEGRIDDDFVCYHCSSTTIHFDLARSAARYDRALRKVLQDFKYHQALWVTRDLVGLLDACFNAHFDEGAVDAVCPVPIHAAKRRYRGYNQAQCLAAGLARRLGKPVLSRSLVKVRPTPSQTNLTASERARNVGGAFGVRWARKLQGKRILLIDDIMTTGATVNECARVLRKGGATSVRVLTVARG